MHRVLLGLLGAPVLLSISSLALSDAQTAQEQFAWRASIDNGQSSLRRIELAPEHLLGATRNDLGDIAVLDANGAPVPMMIQKSPVESVTKEVPLKFSSFSSVAKNRARTVTATEQIQTQSGTSTRKTTEVVSVPESRTDYIVELTPEQQMLGINRLVLQWQGLESDQLLNVRVESVSEFDEFGSGQVRTQSFAQNESLQGWQAITGLVPGKRLSRINVENPPVGLNLVAIKGLFEAKESVNIQWNKAQTMSIDSRAENTFSFQIPKAKAHDYFRLVPASENTIIQGEVFASNRGWAQRKSIFRQVQQHNFEADSRIKSSKELTLPFTRYSEWWFKSEHPIAQAPSVQLGFEPHELVFLANTAAPYTLVWGNKDAAAVRNTLSNLLTDSKQTRSAETVHLAPSEEAGGEQRLKSSDSAWLNWLLWIVLGLAVLFTGKMALSLTKEMGSSR